MPARAAAHGQRSFPHGLEVRTSGDDAHSVVSVIGGIDVATRAVFAASIDAAVAAQAADVILDLGACDFIDSCGLHVIVEAHRAIVIEGGRRFTILPGPGQVQRVFDITGLTAIFTFAA